MDVALSKKRSVWILLVGVMVTLSEVTCCPSQCVCDDVELVSHCDRVNLDVVPLTLNPMIKSLSIANNNIKQIRYSFSIYTNLHSIDMTNNDVQHLANNTFDKQTNLVSLNISHNVLRTIEPRSFHGLSSLLILKLTGNKIVNIASNCFESLTRLEHLDLSDNQIKSLQAYAFKDLKTLRTLSLSNNNLESVPSTAFVPLRNLWKLDLCCNRIEHLPENSFKALRQLRFLYLDSCSILRIDVGAFAGLSSLSRLHLHDNVTPRLNSQAFSDLSRLQELTIGHISDVEVIEAFAFSTVPTLRQLRVINAKSLQVLDLDAFANNTKLETLSFVDNKLLSTIIPSKSSRNSFHHLRQVNFRGSALTSLSQEAFPWERLKSLDLRDNNFVCNCSLRWLKDLLISWSNRTTSERHQHNFPTIYPVTCSLESRHVINPLNDMSDDDLNCGRAGGQQMLMLAILATIMCLIVIAFVAILIRYRYYFQSKLNSPHKEAYIEPRRPIIGESANVMYDTYANHMHSPRRSTPIAPTKV